MIISITAQYASFIVWISILQAFANTDLLKCLFSVHTIQ